MATDPLQTEAAAYRLAAEEADFIRGDSMRGGIQHRTAACAGAECLFDA